MLTEYIARDSLLHRLDVRTKMLWFLVLVSIAFTFDHPLPSCIIVLLVLILFPMSQLPVKGLIRLTAMMSPVFVILFLMTSFTNDPSRFSDPVNQKVLVSLFARNNGALTTGGIMLGATIVLRIVVMVTGSLLLTYTTPIDDFVQVARKLHIPYVATFIMTTALRFIPTLETKAALILDAQRARGADFENKGFIKRIRAYSWLMIPMIVDTIRMSENLAAAMVNRGFGYSPRVTILTELKLTYRDVLLLFIAVGILCGCVALRIGHTLEL
jgi:energy-coupling factor transport system permease protein